MKKESSNDAGEKKVKARKEKTEKSAADKTPSRKQQKKASGNVLEQTLPESPSKIEEVKLLEDGPKAEFRFPLSRQMYSQNGVPFVYSSHGETYASIAKAFDLLDEWDDVVVYKGLASRNANTFKNTDPSF